MAGKWGRSRRARGGVSGVGVTSALGRCSRDATHVQACKESRASAGDGGVPRGFAGAAFVQTFASKALQLWGAQIIPRCCIQKFQVK